MKTVHDKVNGQEESSELVFVVRREKPVSVLAQLCEHLVIPGRVALRSCDYKPAIHFSYSSLFLCLKVSTS